MKIGSVETFPTSAFLLVHRFAILLSVGLASTAIHFSAFRVVAVDELSQADINFFEKKIRPALSQYCYGCHSAKSKEVGGKLYLDQREGILAGGESGAVITPGKPAASLLIQALKYDGTEMPPDQPLPQQVIKDFEDWVKRGAPDPRVPKKKKIAAASPLQLLPDKHWSFFPRKNPIPPTVQNQSWPRDPIDHFVLSRLESEKIKPVTDAPAYTLIRRLHYDLIGLPPSHAAVQQFARDFEQYGQAAVRRVVDQLLASPQYGERWGRHWLDVARYGESNGDDGLGRNASFPQAWRYRDYVVDSFNRDVGYDRFLTEQIAGDLLPATDAMDRNRHMVATGFLAIGAKPAAAMNNNFAMDVVDDQINTVSTVVTGLSVACARCHDHKHDPIPTRDYYALAGIFSSTETLYGRAGDEKLTAPPTKLHALYDQQFDPNTKPVLIRETPRFPSKYKETVSLQKPFLASGLSEKPAELKVEGQVDFSPQAYGKVENSKLIGNFSGPTPSYSVSFWFRNEIKNSKRPITAYLFSRGEVGKKQIGDHLGIGGQHDKSLTGKLFIFNGSATEKSLGGSTVIPPNTWNHIVLIRKGDHVTLYLNGVSEPELNGTLPATFGKSTAFLLATRADHFAPLSGNVAEFAIFDRALQPEEAQILHAASGQPRGVKAPKPFGFAMGVQEKGKPADTKVHINGETGKLGPSVSRGFLTAHLTTGWYPQSKTHSIPPGQSGRLQLANFLTHPDHPQTARVIVNRVWLHLFGQGIVSTPDDFGVYGSRPSHPELLDHLAGRFVQQGWSIKKLIRTIVLTRTYQLDSRGSADLFERDPENIWLGRHLPRRLDAEALRDSLLLAADQLDLAPKAGSDIQDVVKLINWPIGDSTNLHQKSNHRSIYLCMLRHAPPPDLAAFDLPDPTRVIGKRETSTLPSQSLFLLNSPLVIEQANAMAKDLLAQAGWSEVRRIEELYHRTLQRQPSPLELQRAVRYVQSIAQAVTGSSNHYQNWANLCHAVLASNEFRFID